MHHLFLVCYHFVVFSFSCLHLRPLQHFKLADFQEQKDKLRKEISYLKEQLDQQKASREQQMLVWLHTTCTDRKGNWCDCGFLSLFLFLSLCLPLFLSFCLSLFVSLSLCVCLCLSLSLSLCLSVFVSVSLSFSLSLSLAFISELAEAHSMELRRRLDKAGQDRDLALQEAQELSDKLEGEVKEKEELSGKLASMQNQLDDLQYQLEEVSSK